MLGLTTPYAQRLALGKTLGFVFGLLCFLVLTLFTDASLMFRFGMLFWYGTFGVFIALAGTMNKHPVIPMSLPFWFRGILFGAWLNLVILLLAFPSFVGIYTDFAANTFLPALSPFFLVLQGAIIGIVIDYILTKYTGEGENLVASLEKRKKKKFGLF